MSYEDRYYAMCDHNSEQQAEGHSEAFGELISYFDKHRQEIWTKNQIIEALEAFE
jgi:hypothetical protein